jgi:hypothetical protein
MSASAGKFLEEAVRSDAVKRVADVFHYLIVHADVKQYYYELKFVRGGAKLLELVGRALRHLDMFKRDEEHKTKIERLRLPSKEDEAVVLNYYDQLTDNFIRAMSGLVVASCPLCWEERKSEGGSEPRT